MNFYQFHIGDYRGATAHLSNEEDITYRRLIDMYYDTEQPIPLDTQWVSRRLRVGYESVQSVLADFFICSSDGWHNVRCDETISEYHKGAAKNRENGKKGGRPSSKNNPVGSHVDTSGMPVATHWKGNQEPITNNQEPITKDKSKDKLPTAPVDLLAGVDAQVAKDFKELRAKVRAPITATAMSEIVKQADIAGLTLEAALRVCCSRGWRGFKAEWVAPERQVAASKQNRQAGFDQLDYNEGIEDGRIT